MSYEDILCEKGTAGCLILYVGLKGVIGWRSKDLEKEQELIFPWRWRTEPAQTIPSVVAGP